MNTPEPVFAGIDIGTSGVRGVCVDQHLQTLASAAIAFDLNTDDRRNPQLWLESVEQLIRQLLKQIDAARIASIAIDGTSGTMLAVDETGVPQGSALLYNDPCSDKQILNTISAIAPDTSAVHGASSGLARAITLSRRHPNASILHEADWVAFNLSGVLGISDENNALKTGYDPVSRQWPVWLENTGMTLTKLPRVVAAGTMIGSVSRQAQQSTGLHPDTLVVSGTTDGCASLLATGASAPGDGVTVLGSTLTIKLISDKPIYAPEYGIYSHRIGDRWLAGGASNTGGKVLNAFFSEEEIRSLSGTIDPSSNSPLDYYPLISPGERFPINDSTMQPCLEPRPADDAQFLHGILQGIAHIESLAYERLQELGAPELRSIRTMGGGANNNTWSSMRRRKLGVDFLSGISDQAAVGAASLARDGVTGLQGSSL